MSDHREPVRWLVPAPAPARLLTQLLTRQSETTSTATRGRDSGDAGLRAQLHGQDAHAVLRRSSSSSSASDAGAGAVLRPEDLQDDQTAGLAAVLGRCEHLYRLTGHVRTFARLDDGVLDPLARREFRSFR